MVNAKKNLICEEVRNGRIKECWTCSGCGKHHTIADGADKCCTDSKSTKCQCRHCGN